MREVNEVVEHCTFSPDIRSQDDRSEGRPSKSTKMTPKKSQKFFDKNIEWKERSNMQTQKLKMEIHET